MPLYEKYVGRSRDDFATLEDLQKNYKVTVGDDFNYSYDVVDEIARQTPDKLAMLWVSNEGVERRFTFEDLRRLSNQAANLLTSLGVGKGDCVMLVLKRGYQFWYTLLALHRIGAIAAHRQGLRLPRQRRHRQDDDHHRRRRRHRPRRRGDARVPHRAVLRRDQAQAGGRNVDGL